MIGTAVRVEGISSKGEESSIGREFTIPVRKTNIRNPIYARNIKLRERSGEIGICFTYYDERPLRALLADITLCSIFGEYKINGDYYCEFQKYQSNIYQTEFMVKDIPSHIRGMITHADVLIKECVFDDELLRIESLDLLSIEEVEEKMVDASDDELLRIESSDLPSIEEEDTMVEQKADGLDNSNSDNMSLFEELVKLNTSKEMLEYVETHKDSISSAVVDELTKKLQERWIYERTYGVRKDRTIKEIESILGVD